MARVNRFAGLAAMAAAVSMAATPLAAAELPQPKSSRDATMIGVFDADAVNADNHRRWRRDRVDAGDVIAGVLIIGGIAAIANAATKDKRERDYRYRDNDYRYRDYRNEDYRYREDNRYRDRRGDMRYSDGRGIDNAVRMCLAEVERDVRVEGVDSVERSGEGWRVEGSLYNGRSFTCTIGADGRIETIDTGGRFSAQEDNQHDDDRYAAAWRERDAGRLDDAPRQAQAPQAAPASGAPAYPGGPVDGDIAQDDGRYSTADEGAL